MSLVVGAFTMGLILALLSLGMLISFRMIRFTDITVDGSITLGASVTALMIVQGWSPWLAALMAFLAGGAAGMITGVLHTRFKIQEILSGILMMTALYSINPKFVKNFSLTARNQMLHLRKPFQIVDICSHVYARFYP